LSKVRKSNRGVSGSITGIAGEEAGAWSTPKRVDQATTPKMSPMKRTLAKRRFLIIYYLLLALIVRDDNLNRLVGRIPRSISRFVNNRIDASLSGATSLGSNE